MRQRQPGSTAAPGDEDFLQSNRSQGSRQFAQANGGEGRQGTGVQTAAADLPARECGAIHQEYCPTAAGQFARRQRTGRPRPNNDHIRRPW